MNDRIVDGEVDIVKVLYTNGLCKPASQQLIGDDHAVELYCSYLIT